MELDYRLPIPFSVLQGGRNILVTFCFSATLLIVHKLISPVNWGSAKGTRLLEYCLRSPTAFELDSEMIHDTSKLF